MAIKPYLVLDGGIDCEKTGGPAKQVERRGRTKSGPMIPMRFEHEHDDEPLVAASPRCASVVNPMGGPAELYRLVG